MRARIIVGVAVVIVALGVGALASRAGDVTSSRQWTIVNFPDAVQVKDTLIMGPVLIVHDSEKMARGEPCTTFYRFDAARGQQEPLVSLHCKPRMTDKPASATQIVTTLDDPACRKLVEYQVAGDAEAHGVPGK